MFLDKVYGKIIQLFSELNYIRLLEGIIKIHLKKLIISNSLYVIIYHARSQDKFP